MSLVSDTIRILHVDDEPGLAEMAATFLQRKDEQFTVETATRASEGLERLADGDIDCIVSDYDMPGQNGIEFLEAVREEHPELPFILFTGKGSEEVASDAISAGVTDYLQKESGTEQYTVLANRIRNSVEKYYAETLVDRAYQAMDRSREGIALLDSSGEFIYVNEAYTGIVGYDEDELIGEFWERVYPDEQVEHVYEDILPTIPEQGHWTGDTVYQRKDGSRILVNHALAYSEEGTMICLLRDLTDIEAQRRALHQEQQRFDLFVDAVEDYAILMLDPEGHIVSWNSGAERIKGYTEDEILGKHFSVLYPEELCQAGLPDELLEQAQENGPVEQDGPRLRKDGSTFQANTLITAVYDEDGTHRGFSKVTKDITAQQEHEREREQIIERVTDAIVEVDADWQFTLVNQQAEDLYDMAAEDLLGRDFWEVFKEAKGTRFEEEYREVMETRESTSFVEYFSQLDGWFDIEAYPKDDGGIAFYFVEVTEQRERQEELERANTVLSTLFETLPVGVLAEDASRNVIELNDRLFELFEFPGAPEAVIGADGEQMARQVSEMFVDPDGFVERINDLVANREPTDNEELALTNGRTFERSYRPIQLPNGDGHLWMYRDITERKEREQRYNAIFNNTYQFTGLLEPDGTLIEANETALEFGGLDREDVLGKKMWEAYWFQHSEDTKTRAREAVERAANGEFVRHELPVQGATEEVIIDFSVRPLTDDQGNVTLLIPEGRNITEQHTYEQTIQQQNERLEEFASVVSHDLRNPLNIVGGRLELAPEECDSEHLDHIARAAERMNLLIEDLLTLAQEGDTVGDTEATDLRTLTADCWGNVATAEATLVTDIDRQIQADKSRLQQLFENLMRNAVEHGGEDVTVTVGGLDDGFYVEDDGPGIPEDDRNEVFEAGYSTSDEGTGFGLSIVKQIADAHGWNIRVIEGSDGGARFEITGLEFAE